MTADGAGADGREPGGIVIVGGGLGAVRTVDQLRRQNHDGPITIVGDESKPST